MVSEVDLGSPPHPQLPPCKLPKPSLCSVCSRFPSQALAKRPTAEFSHLCHHTHDWDVCLYSCAHMCLWPRCLSVTVLRRSLLSVALATSSRNPGRLSIVFAIFQLVLVEDSIQAEGRSPVSTKGSVSTPCPSAQLPQD